MFRLILTRFAEEKVYWFLAAFLLGKFMLKSWKLLFRCSLDQNLDKMCWEIYAETFTVQSVAWHNWWQSGSRGAVFVEINWWFYSAGWETWKDVFSLACWRFSQLSSWKNVRQTYFFPHIENKQKLCFKNEPYFSVISKILHGFSKWKKCYESWCGRPMGPLENLNHSQTSIHRKFVKSL